MKGNPARLREHGFEIEGYEIDQLISMLRYTDDGNPASFVYCWGCLQAYVKLCWGSRMSTSVEEHGQPQSNYEIKMLDTVETFVHGASHMRPLDKNEITAAITPDFQIMRYCPAPLTEHHVRYVRGLVLGKLSRSIQIIGDNNAWIHGRDLLIMMAELCREDNGYTWRCMLKACTGCRKAWARPTIALVRGITHQMLHNRNEGRPFAGA